MCSSASRRPIYTKPKRVNSLRPQEKIGILVEAAHGLERPREPKNAQNAAFRRGLKSLSPVGLVYPILRAEI